MVRWQKRKRPPFRLPVRIYLYAAPPGWRFSITPKGGGFVCGRLTDEPLEPEAAVAEATTMVTAFARDFHRTAVEVTWTAGPDSPGSTGDVQSWGGEVIPLPDVVADPVRDAG